MGEADFYLPHECWESIVTFLNDDNNHHLSSLKSLSVVSKQFLSITNSRRFSLTLIEQTHPFLHSLFKRFTNLTALDLTHFNGNLNLLLSQISYFQLKLTSLNLSYQPTIPSNGLRVFSQNITTLTSLICSHIKSLHSTDLFLISDCFPLLEELDLSYPTIKDYRSFLNGLESLSSVLFNLCKVDLSGHSYVNDSLLLHLCKNCEFLEEVRILNCSFITHHGISSALRERPTLKSLSITCRSIGSHDDNISSHLLDSFLSLKVLTCLDLSFSRISDELLSSIAKAGLPLRSLVLEDCTGYSYAGIFSLLSKCHCIQHLDLQGAEFLNDHHLIKLSMFLGDLVSIKLSDCEDLTESALFSLVSNCPSLSEIRMESTPIGEMSVENSSNVGFTVSPQLKSLYLTFNKCVREESIKMIASIFPNLQLLDLSYSYNIYEEGMCHVLRRCCNIKHLNLACCSSVKLRGLNFDVPKLEVLNLSHTKVDDKALHVISKSCSGLLQLLLEFCEDVTEKGMRHVAKNCTQLREINLRGCDKVRGDVVEKMVFSRPSLRKITAPPRYRFSDKKTKLFSSHGCLVL